MSKANQRLQVGALAPDITLIDAEAEAVKLAGLWEKGPTVLTFLRHFG